MGKVIYEDKLMQELRRMRELPDDVRVKVLAAVSRQPAADVAPVVRCKDCKWWKTNACFFYQHRYHCADRAPDDFCSDGEKMEGDASD